MKKIILLILSAASINSYAVESADQEAKKILNSDGYECPVGLVPDEKGWWWGCVEPDRKAKKPLKLKIGPKGPTPEQKKKLCENPNTWDAEKCGFVNPNKIKDYKKAFEFQKKQQKELSKNMVIHPDNAKIVLEYQKYNKWMLKQAVMASKTWKFNNVQNPEMDFRTKNPISTYGFVMATQLKNIDKKNVFSLLKDEGAYFVWFTKEDCVYCHKQAKSFKRLHKRVEGIPFYNISLKGKCLDGFDKDHCMLRSKKTEAAATRLQVKIVPSLFMFIPNDKDVSELGGTWMRIATGLVDDSTIVNRSYTFFKANANAIKKGISSALKNQPAVDFSYESPTGVLSVSGLDKKVSNNEKQK